MHRRASGPEPTRSSSRSRLLLALLLAGIGGCVLGVLVDGRDGTVQDSVAGPMLLVISVAGTALAAAAGFSRRLDRRTRLAWRVLAVALAVATAACVAFAVDETFPGPADVLRLASAPVFFVGLLLFPVTRRTRRDRQRLALDTGIVVSCGFIVLWYWSLGPALVTPGLSREVAAVAVAYPLADLVLLLGATKALLGGLSPSSRRPLLLLVVGLVVLVGADAHVAHVQVEQAVSGRAGRETAPLAEWLFLLLAFGLMALAAADQLGQGVGPHVDAPAERRMGTVSLLPYLAVALGYGLLVVVASGADLYPWGGLVAGAVAMTGLVVTRQVLELQESHTLAATDPLTGLATRPRLNDAMLRALADAERTGVTAALLVVDVDDFKTVNDTLGHQAGDEALVQLTAALRASVSRTDTVGRLGGDEFAIVLPAVADEANAGAVARRITDTLAAPVVLAGSPSLLKVSIGVAVSGPGDTLQTMLHRADGAMYAVKRRTARAGQAADPGARSPRSPTPGPLPGPPGWSGS